MHKCGLQRRAVSVHPSVCHVRVFCWNCWVAPPFQFFSVANVMAMFRWGPLTWAKIIIIGWWVLDRCVLSTFQRWSISYSTYASRSTFHLPRISESCLWHAASTLRWRQQNCARLVAWHSGRTLVFDWRTFPVLRSTCSWRVTTYVGKPVRCRSTRPTQPFILGSR